MKTIRIELSVGQAIVIKNLCRSMVSILWHYKSEEAKFYKDLADLFSEKIYKVEEEVRGNER